MSGEYLLMIGSDRPNKNIWRGLQGYIEFARTSTSFPALCIVGHYADAFQAELASVIPKSLRSRVYIRGFVSDTEYQELFSGCTGVLFPSLYEGFGIPVAEAVSQGKRVLVSQGTVCEEIAGSFGIVVDTRDISQVSLGIVKLLRPGRRCIFRGIFSEFECISRLRIPRAGFTQRIKCCRRDRMTDISALLSVYHQTTPGELSLCLESINNQSLKPHGNRGGSGRPG